MDKNRVLLIVNKNKSIPEQAISRVAELLRARGHSVVSFKESEEDVSFAAGGSYDGSVEPDSIPDFVKFAVVFGGDGSIIRAASVLSPVGIPMVGVNFGGVGYLAELEYEDIPLIDRIIDGDYEIDSRMMLEAIIYRKSGDSVRTSSALNDIVLSNGPIANLLSFDLLCNGVNLRSFRADGMIVATATGSTAYSMSAGGPVLDPSLSAVLITPICPHSIGSRPVVLNGDSVLELDNIISRKNSVYLSIDGREAVELFPGDSVRIKRSATVTKLIRLKSKDFLGVLKNKLSDK